MEFNLSEILIIDDDEVVKIVEKRLLRRMEFTKPILCFDNGEQALSFIRKRLVRSDLAKPSLILLDVDMPIMDCWGFLDEFEKLDSKTRSSYKIIIRTSSIDPIDKERALALDYIGEFMYKPLSPDLLFKVFKRMSVV
ncbi:two-component system response regulator [Algoriphagus sp. Y33]|uniref:response regulator n=1 Tax=Algoriphagus sp. Y33 TaxID=2772483 RepID=UPI00177B244B|nr:response regulator [Algoriphagus sp. Y33]